MTRKTYKTIETPSGIGEIRKSGEHLANVSYRLQVRQEIIVSESFSKKEEIPGMAIISGEITINQDERMKSVILNNMSSGESFTLYLSDNRRLELFASKGDPVSGKYQVSPFGSQGLVSG